MKIKGPLHSESASGSLKGRIVFSMRNGVPFARFQKAQKDKLTSARTAQRNKFLEARSMWTLNDFGVVEFGYNLIGGQSVNVMLLPQRKRTPQFARFVSDVLNFYF